MVGIIEPGVNPCLKLLNCLKLAVVRLCLLPKAFRFEGKEVFIRKEGSRVILSEKPESWEGFFNSQMQVTEDFMAERVDLPLQKRKLFE